MKKLFGAILLAFALFTQAEELECMECYDLIIYDSLGNVVTGANFYANDEFDTNGEVTEETITYTRSARSGKTCLEWRNIYDLRGRLTGRQCVKWSDDSEPETDNGTGVYVGEDGSKYVVLDGKLHNVSTVVINNQLIRSTDKALVVSMSGLYVYLDGAAIDNTPPFITHRTGAAPYEGRNYGDMIYRKSFEFSKKYDDVVGVAMYPYQGGTQQVLESAGELIINFISEPTKGAEHLNASYFQPERDVFAKMLKKSLGFMASDAKLIMIAKSLGGAIYHETTSYLRNLDVDVDLLILVDASNYPADHSWQYLTIPDNVKKVVNIRQTQPSSKNDGQNGYRISWSAPTEGYDYVMSEGCPDVGHKGIDDCQAVQDLVTRIVEKELRGPDMTPINMLLLD